MTSRARKIIIGLAAVALIVVAAFGFLAGAAVYGWKAAVRAGNEAATIQNLKTIAAVEIQYYNTHQRTFGTFADLTREDMLSSKFAGDPVVADGYVFELQVTGGTQSKFVLNGDPRDDSSGKNHFYIDSSSQKIHVNADTRAGAFDPIQ